MIILKDDEKLSTDALMSLIGKIIGIIYVRVSTADQAKKGYSLESQIERCQDRALKKFGIKDDELIALIEAGGMGDDPNRPALNYALYLLEKGLGNKFFVLHPDRLTRDNTLQGIVSRKIWSLGADLEFIEFEVDPTNPESMLMYNIQGSIAQYNKAKILANSKRGRIQKAKKGEIPNFRRLYGYTYNKENDILEVNETEKDVILEMVKMLLEQDKSCNQIAIELSKKGIEAPNGKIWYQTTVSRILRNEDYTGVYYHGKTQVIQKQGVKKQIAKPKEEWIKISIPIIIDINTFEKIQEKIDLFTKNKGRKSKDYLLKGIARCGRCGGAAGSGITSKVKSGTYKYYACRKKASKGYKVGTGENVNVCEGKNWRVDIVDEIVWGEVYKLISNDEEAAKYFFNNSMDKEKIKNLMDKKSKLEKQISDLEKEETNYIILFGKGKISEIQFDTLTSPIKESKDIFEGEIEDTNKELLTMEKSQDEKKSVSNFLSRIKKSFKSKDVSSKDKRKLINLLIEKVYLHEDDRIEIFWKFEPNNDDQHKKRNNGLNDGFIFYVTTDTVLPKQEYKNGKHIYAWENRLNQSDELIEMNYKKLMTPFEIYRETGIDVKDIEKIFQAKNIKLYKLKDISKIKRQNDFDALYDLYFNKKLSLNEIYRQFGYSQPYVKRVFEEHGVKR